MSSDKPSCRKCVYTDQAFPEVFLFGNGLIYDSNDISWEDLIRKINSNENLPDKMCSPYPIQIILATGDNVDMTLRDKKREFYGRLKSEKVRKLLERILSFGFDDILTTNYSYELESAAMGKETVSDHFLRNSLYSMRSDKAKDKKYVISTCRRLTYKGVDNRVWHIHGEARKPYGMIIGHYYYGTYLNRIMNYLDSRHGSYRNNENGRSIIGWPDSFIKGNVYILGQGLDIAEFDLWWLINRKKRETSKHGKIYFYTCDLDEEKAEHREKKELLRLMDVEIIDLSGMFKTEPDKDRNETYLDFYEYPIERIREQIDKNRTMSEDLFL